MELKKHSRFTRFIAICFAITFLFVSLNTIDAHSFTVGVENIHVHYGGCFPIANPVHLSGACPYGFFY